MHLFLITVSGEAMTSEVKQLNAEEACAHWLIDKPSHLDLTHQMLVLLVFTDMLCFTILVSRVWVSLLRLGRHTKYELFKF